MEFITPKISQESKEKGSPFIFAGRNPKSFFFQPKLTIGPVDDPYEREADAVADKVIRMKDHDQQFIQPKISSLNIQRKCAECGAEEKKLQKKDNGKGPGVAEAPSIVNDVINSSGRVLDLATKSSMEKRFGYDFSDVKIHTDSIAAKSAQSINALAYTSGNNIVFNDGQYSPNTKNGRLLLAHELTHVVQQTSGNSEVHSNLAKPKNTDSGVLQRSDDPYAPPLPSEPTPELPQPNFKCGLGTLKVNDIGTKDSFRDNGNSFRFGHGVPPVFSWENEVFAYGGSDIQFSNWQVGFVQLMKDYWFNVWWGDEGDEIHCGGSFADCNVRDVKYERSESAWFNGTGSDPFGFNGDKKKIKIEDSPGALDVPYSHPKKKAGANFGHFNFGCTYYTYISAFNYANPESRNAWKHIKSVYWQTMLAGQFDGRLPANQRLTVTDGGLTERGERMNGYPKNSPPSLSGRTGHDITCPVQKCWDQELTCRQVTVPD